MASHWQLVLLSRTPIELASLSHRSLATPTGGHLALATPRHRPGQLDLLSSAARLY